jgi:hypothetical protein
MRTPKIVGRVFKPFDWFGWAMSLLGISLMCKFGGVGWIFGNDKNWWLFALTFMLFWEYAFRVAFGKVYKFVYFDTIVRKMYEVKIDDKTFFVCAASEEDLDLYIESVYPGMEYEVIQDTIVESFIKTEHFI